MKSRQFMDFALGPKLDPTTSWDPIVQSGTAKGLMSA